MTKNPNKVTHRPDGTSVIEIVRKDGTVLECIIDTVDYPQVAGYRWHAHIKRGLLYALAGNSKTRMHVLLMGEKGFDHVDRNGLRNTRDNLRPATKTQQIANQGTRKDSSTGERGVYWDKGNGKYRAQLQMSGNRKNLGLFTTLAEAAVVARAARAAAFKEFAA